MLASSLLLMLAATADPACAPQRPMESVVSRPSKYDSTVTKVGEATVKICYGRPLAKGRTIFGSAIVPYGKLWRTGANEPTILHTTGPITVAGVKLKAGSYSLYTVPMKDGPWEVVLNASISQWGHERFYDDVKAQELGRGKAATRVLSSPVEAFTISLSARAIDLSWENTAVSIPVSPQS